MRPPSTLPPSTSSACEDTASADAAAAAGGASERAGRLPAVGEAGLTSAKSSRSGAKAGRSLASCRGKGEGGSWEGDRGPARGGPS